MIALFVGSIKTIRALDSCHLGRGGGGGMVVISSVDSVEAILVTEILI